ncbi:MAG: transposase, partial [Planctomycetaceae bacterium]|nr:transposase [Planctomycetaceae bacterium]
DDVKQLKEDVRAGRIDADRLVDVVVTLQHALQEARRRIEELEKKLGGSATVRVDEPFSLRAEERRQAVRGKKPRKRNRPLRRGRITTADKLALAQRTEQVFPVGVAKRDCHLSHTRPVWRLENGQAVLVAYEIYRGPKSQFGRIPGVLGRSEFGLEIVVAIAYQVYIVGLSFDKVCLLLNFFQNLRLRKSQVDALLHQLSRHWASEFEGLCTLLANSAVVHTDETGWSLNSVWAFLSEKVRVLFFGVHKDAATLEQILDPATFAGIVVSDDAAVYANFTRSQKCWAHLLRKAIKLTLLEPANGEYRRFADRLLEIYRAACRTQRDGRFSDAGRAQKVAELDDEILELCAAMWIAELPPLAGPADDYRLLCNELMRLMLAQQLFTFVTAAPVKMPRGEATPVAGTNNESERTLRAAAQARKTGRTSKTLRGARRQTILVSVLESVRRQLPTFTLSSVIGEVLHWSEAGRSCFAKLLKKLHLTPPGKSILDLVLPVPGG